MPTTAGAPQATTPSAPSADPATAVQPPPVDAQPPQARRPDGSVPRSDAPSHSSDPTSHASSKASSPPAPVLAVATPGKPPEGADRSALANTSAQPDGSSDAAHAAPRPHTLPHGAADNLTTPGVAVGAASHTDAGAALTTLLSGPFTTDAGAKDALAQAQPLPVPPSADGYGTDEQANLSRVVRGLSAALNQKGGAVTLRLSPPELGLVRIQIQISQGVVRAEIFTEHASARSLLADGLTELRQALQGHGLSVDRLGVQTMTTTSPSPGPESSGRMNAGQDGGRSRGSFSQEPGRQDHPSDRPGRETFDFDSQLARAVV
ncbi:MAG: flagellar hook-length control protein FliK [Phycisphaeraceae bacterium]|nr:flagellar hook-length control protein FliK [Phycisphaeraceae bacterium]